MQTLMLTDEGLTILVFPHTQRAVMIWPGGSSVVSLPCAAIYHLARAEQLTRISAVEDTQAHLQEIARQRVAAGLEG